MIRKWFVLAITSITVLMTFTSCGLDYRYSLDENLHNKIQYIPNEDSFSDIVYNGTLYRWAGTTDFFGITRHDEDVKLSWNGHRYIWYIDEYYSYSADKPLFIYFARTHAYYVYFREDYNYKKDVFTIDDTDSEIVFEDIVSSKCEDVDISYDHWVLLKSKTNSRIEILAWMALSDGKLYLCFDSTHDNWIASDEFIDLLFQEGILINKE